MNWMSNTHQIQRKERMMSDMMNGDMMWGMGLFGLLILLLLVLGVGALVKYLFFGGRRK